MSSDVAAVVDSMRVYAFPFMRLDEKKHIGPVVQLLQLLVVFISHTHSHTSGTCLAQELKLNDFEN